MFLSMTLGIQVLEIDCSPWRSILFGDYFHGTAPFDWSTYGNWNNNTTLNVMVKTFLYFGFPMVWNRKWTVPS